MMAPQFEKIHIGISTCLLGQNVRFDGGHKRQRFITDVLGEYFSWVPVCPEIEVGMGMPRESVRLIRDGKDVRMVAPKSGRDWTRDMNLYTAKRLETLREHRLRGYILKKDSPTCGMERVRVYDKNNIPSNKGVGLYASALLNAYPRLPVEEEGRLQDPALRENFITRVFTYDRFLGMRERGATPGKLVAFHTGHKLLILSHHPKLYQQLGRLVAQAGSTALEPLLDEYESLLMSALESIATRKRHVNVMHHLCGFLKTQLTPQEKQELLNAIEEYRKQWVPLITPLTLLNHHLRALKHAWVEAQFYLNPYPRALALRSQI